MAFAPISTGIHIYRYNGIDYNHFQTITFQQSATRNIEFNKYKELMVADTHDFTSYLFRYNETILQFSEVIISAKSTSYISPVLATTIVDKTMIETAQF